MRRTVSVAVMAVLACTVVGCTDSSKPDVTPAPSSDQPSASASAVSESAPAEDHGRTVTANGSVTGGPSSFVYTVASGDAVTGIAARFGLCTSDIYLANEDPEVYGHELAVGQQLTIRRMVGPGHTTEQCDLPYPDGVY